MASIADVFTESERTNWLKALLAIDIARSGLEPFVENAAKTLHDNIYNAILTSGAVACISCHTANLLKCPSTGICNTRNSLCTNMHDNPLKQPRPCPANVCNKVLVEIEKQHKCHHPSWKNTLANLWHSSPWEIAKAYLPPDGYIGKSSVQDTDFNGIISFMMNCKHFDTMFSFPIAPRKLHPPCLLTKARDIGKTVRHLSKCKVTDTDLQDFFITLTSLLTDQKCLAHDVAAQEAVRKLAKLQTDVLKLTTEEILDLLKARRQTTNTEYDQSCTDFRRRLIAHYNETSINVPLSNLDQSLDKPIVDIYATPKIYRIDIEKDGKRVKNERVLTYKDIFYTEDNTNRRIYLQGEPGRGKSTFSAKLVYDWSHSYQVSAASSSDTSASDDMLAIQQFKFLFFITLRDSRDQTDVSQMIKRQLIDKTFSEDERADVYKLFVQIMNSENCLVIREGLDEWVSPDGSNLAEPSMAGFQNDTCTVLTTSRPWKLADERIKNSQIDCLLEIEGISDPCKFCENILRCITDKTNDLKETAGKFQSFMYDRKLNSLSSSPMLYALVICTWVNTIEEKKHLKGSSLCELYTTLLESLCKKANSATGYFNDSNPPPVRCFASTIYLQPNIEHLAKLAQVAFKLLFSSERESSIVFNDITLSNYVSQEEFSVLKTFALKAGILTNRKEKCRNASSYSFVHKTVQEYFAAYHIACNSYVIDDVITGYLEGDSKSYLEISQSFIFLCGMNITAANKLSALMDKYDVAYCAVLGRMPCKFQLIIESGMREAAANNQDGKQLKLSHDIYLDPKSLDCMFIMLHHGPPGWIKHLFDKV